MIDPIELHALADGELAPEREAVLRRLVDSSPDAAAELKAILTVKAVLRTRISPVDGSAEWSRCVARLGEMDRTRRIERVVSGRLAWGLCGVFFALILGAGVMHRGSNSANMNSADLAWMVGSFRPAHEASRTPSRTTEAVDELMKMAKISIDPKRMEVLQRGYGELDGRQVVRFTLRDANGDLALVVVPDVLQLDGLGRRDHTFHIGHVGPMNCVGWTDGKNTLVLVADRPYEDLATVASSLEVK